MTRSPKRRRTRRTTLVVDRPTLQIRDINAGDAFRNTLLPRRDIVDGGECPLWYGWAILEAFLAGATFARSETAPRRLKP